MRTSTKTVVAPGSSCIQVVLVNVSQIPVMTEQLILLQGNVKAVFHVLVVRDMSSFKLLKIEFYSFAAVCIMHNSIVSSIVRSDMLDVIG